MVKERNEIQSAPYHGQIKYTTVFSWLPIRCVNGECAWLEKVKLVKEYRMDPSGHWINKEFK